MLEFRAGDEVRLEGTDYEGRVESTEFLSHLLVSLKGAPGMVFSWWPRNKCHLLWYGIDLLAEMEKIMKDILAKEENLSLPEYTAGERVWARYDSAKPIAGTIVAGCDGCYWVRFDVPQGEVRFCTYLGKHLQRMAPRKG